MSVSAVTDDATLRVLFWGGDAGVPAAAGGQTRTTDIPDGDASIINAAKPKYTKVVVTAFVAMDQAERDAVDAVLDPPANVVITNQRLASIRAGVVHDYGVKAAAFSIDLSNGNGLHQAFTLGADLTTAGDIDLIVAGDAPMDVQLRVKQDPVTQREISGDAWTVSGGIVKFGTVGAPSFIGDALGAERLIVLAYRKPNVLLLWTDNAF